MARPQRLRPCLHLSLPGCRPQRAGSLRALHRALELTRSPRSLPLPPPVPVPIFTMDRPSLVFMAKLAEQAERFDEVSLVLRRRARERE